MWEGSYPSRTKESVFSWDIVAQWTASSLTKKNIHSDGHPKAPRPREPADVPF